jgi:hypothetical protein
MSEVNKDEDAQLQWDNEAKRIEQIKNPEPEVVSEPTTEPEVVSEPTTEPEESQLPEISIQTSYDG